MIRQAPFLQEAALAKFQGRVAAKRRDHLHKVARKLVTRFGRIGIEISTSRASPAAGWRNMFTTPRGRS